MADQQLPSGTVAVPRSPAAAPPHGEPAPADAPSSSRPTSPPYAPEPAGPGAPAGAVAPASWTAGGPAWAPEVGTTATPSTASPSTPDPSTTNPPPPPRPAPLGAPGAGAAVPPPAPPAPPTPTGPYSTPPGSPPPAAPPEGPGPRSGGGGGRKVLAGLAGLALLLGAGTGGAAIALALDDDPAPRPVTSLSASPPDDEGADASGASSEPDEPLSQVADAVLPSVVSIGIETAQGEGEGSGVIISEDGLILTNNHVAAEGEGGTLTVLFHDGTRAEAEIVGLDPQSDLAVIQAEDVSGLTPATLGSSDDLNVGDTVLAIGSPLGLDGSVTAGIVSALNRAITLGGESSPFGEQNPNATSAVIDAIQTDAAINPGNSGGALINARGEVVGINTAIASAASGAVGQQSGNIGVGFAVPIDDARSIADQLVEDGTATHAYMGVQIRDADTGGALLGAVESGSPAEEAGLQDGDIVTAVDGDPVTDATDLTAAVRGNAPGDRVAITYTRDGEDNEVEVTLGTLPTG